MKAINYACFKMDEKTTRCVKKKTSKFEVMLDNIGIEKVILTPILA